jgi:hypothetical protein
VNPQDQHENNIENDQAQSTSNVVETVFPKIAPHPSPASVYPNKNSHIYSSVYSQENKTQSEDSPIPPKKHFYARVPFWVIVSIVIVAAALCYGYFSSSSSNSILGWVNPFTKTKAGNTKISNQSSQSLSISNPNGQYTDLETQIEGKIHTVTVYDKTISGKYYSAPVFSSTSFLATDLNSGKPVANPNPNSRSYKAIQYFDGHLGIGFDVFNRSHEKMTRKGYNNTGSIYLNGFYIRDNDNIGKYTNQQQMFEKAKKQDIYQYHLYSNSIINVEPDKAFCGKVETYNSDGKSIEPYTPDEKINYIFSEWRCTYRQFIAIPNADTRSLIYSFQVEVGRSTSSEQIYDSVVKQAAIDFYNTHVKNQINEVN